jgi:hypothetical protein
MLGFLRFILNKLCGKPRGRTNQQCEPENDSPTDTFPISRRILLFGGLVLLLLGMLYGAVFGTFFLENLNELKGSLLRDAIMLGEKGNIINAKQRLEEMKKAEELLDALRGSHAHLSLLGLVAIALAGNIQRIQLKEKLKTAAAVIFLLSGLLFPISILLETQIKPPIGKIIVILFGTLIIACTATYTLGAWKSLKKPKQQPAN